MFKIGWMTISAVLFFFQCQSQILQQQYGCHCQNQGLCIDESQNSTCLCNHNFLGYSCEAKALQLTQTPIAANITNNYSYFYITFNATTLYYVSFTLCSLKTKSSTMFQNFIEYENKDGSIAQNPPQISLFSFSSQDNQCLSVNFIVFAFRKNLNGQFSKIILRIKSIQKSNDQFSQNQSIEDTEQSQIQLSSVKHQLYELQNFIDGKDILVFLLLFVLFACLMLLVLFRMIRRQRRRQLSNEMLIHPINNILHFQALMPASLFEAKEISNNEEECMICLLTVQNSLVRTTPCNHLFHKDCIDEWGKKKLNCPICRANLSEQLQQSRAEV